MTAALDRLLAPLLALTIFAFGCGSSIVDPVLLVGRPLRWIMLFALLAAAAANLVAGRPRAAPVELLALAAFLAAVALASTLWSVDPGLTFRHAASFVAMLVAASALVAGSLDRVDAVRRLLAAIAGGAAAVAVAGLVVLAVDSGSAIQAASTEYGARYQGFEQNPNTAAMLLALATPIAVLFVLDARSRAGRAAALAALFLFAGSLAASGARGPMVGALLGALVVVLARPAPRRTRLRLAALAAAVFVVCLGVSRIPQPTTAPPGVDTRLAYSQRRTLFTSSGRLSTWGGAIRQAGSRPVAGYGFGTEAIVFVNRSSAFVSDLPENSYIGAALQLGLVGLALLVGIAAYAASLFVRALSRLGDGRGSAAASAGALAAALTVAVTQSYLFAVGNIATLSAWLTLFLLAGVSATADA